MQEHAVPRDITGFKFKLIGDMTIKQFAELAFGAIVAYIIFASGLYPLFKWPLVVFFALFGVALAFLPIQERPLDVWIINFFKAIYRPTYFVWKKDLSARSVTEADFQPGYLNMDTITQHDPARAAAPSLATIPVDVTASRQSVVSTPEPKQQEDGSKKKEGEEKDGEAAPTEKPTGQPISVEDLMAMREKTVADESPATVNGAPLEEQGDAIGLMTIDSLVNLREQKLQVKDSEDKEQINKRQKEIDDLANQVKALMIEIDEIKAKLAGGGENQVELETKLAGLVEERAKLATQLSAIRKEVSNERAQSVALPEYKEVNKVPTRTRVVKPKANTNVMPTIRLTDLPNVINGLVTDSAAKPVDGAILIIKDQQGNSIRAFKTNKIGQFVVSTPMQNGTYYIELEKEGLSFDTLEVTLDGNILEPLTIAAKAVDAPIITQP